MQNFGFTFLIWILMKPCRIRTVSFAVFVPFVIFVLESGGPDQEGREVIWWPGKRGGKQTGGSEIVSPPPVILKCAWCGAGYAGNWIGMPIRGHSTYTANPVTIISRILAGMP